MSQAKTKKKYLIDYVQLMEEWDWEKNNELGLVPSNLLSQSNKKAFWKCAKGHEWQAVIWNRAKGSGCPYCAGQRVIPGQNDLLSIFPDLANDWHPEKNGLLTPRNVMSKSSKKVWWLCSTCGYEWEDTLSHRANGRKCPSCTKKINALRVRDRVVNDSNRLSTNYPELIKSLNSKKNGDLLPENVTCGSSKKVWWICEKGHEWQDSPAHRCNRGYGCPYCSHHRVDVGVNDLASMYPDVASEWDYSKNGMLKPTNVLCNSNKKVGWICSTCGHKWETTIVTRTAGSKCPVCMYAMRGQKRSATAVNEKTRLSTFKPQLSKSWNNNKNYPITPADVSYGSNRMVWWLCDNGHEWQASICNRVKGRGCPYCGNKKILIGYNDLLSTYPVVAKEWHPSKNGELGPTDVMYGSNKKVWWKCEKGHEWQAVVFTRTMKDVGCPECTKYSRSSFPEQAIFYYVKKCYPDAINSFRDCFQNGMEIDIYIPSLNLGIEYDGVLHEYEQDKKKHVVCKANDIRLIRIKEASKRYPANKTDQEVCDNLIYVSESTNQLDKNVFDKLRPLLNLPNDIDVNRDRNAIYASYMNTKKEDSLEACFPKIAEEWHQSKNGNITPRMVYKGTTSKFWWKCEFNHEWEERISVRTQRGTGCPYCSSHRLMIGFNDFATVFSETAKEWHPSKNGHLKPQMFFKRSSSKVWWMCDKGHEWQASICNRAKGSGCPVCAGRNRKVQNIETGEVFGSYSEAAKALGLANGDGISLCCQGKKTTAGGYHWCFLI